MWGVATVALSTTVAAGFVPDPGPWLPTAEILPALEAVGSPLAVGDVVARALIALPASLVVAIGLRRTTHLVGPMAGSGVTSALRAASVAFVVFGCSPGSFRCRPFPLASVLNEQVVLETLGIPIEVFLSLTGLAIAVAVILSLQLLEHETDRILAEARRRELCSASASASAATCTTGSSSRSTPPASTSSRRRTMQRPSRGRRRPVSGR